MENFKRYYRRFGIYTILAVYFLILVGGLVRASGSGMGCPDWPKCFGQWVPPTTISELPSNYKEVYGVNGVLVEDFNSLKTWTEYLNRLIGVVIGLFVFITFIFSIGFFNSDRFIFFGSFVSLVLVGFQGWLGAKVVSSNLSPYKITAHMLLALFIVCLLIYCIYRSQQFVLQLGTKFISNKAFILGIVVLLFSVAQLIMGTQVRQEVDVLSHEGLVLRENWISSLGSLFYIHRSFSIIVLGSNMYLYHLLKELFLSNSAATIFLKMVGVCILIEIFIGMALNYLGFPVYLQPVHLFIGSVLIGAQFVVLLIIKQNTQTISKG